MVEMLLNWVSEPGTAILVLVGAGAIIAIEATRQGREALWGEFVCNDPDEE
ncbi:MAG: hypothetical protein AAGH87_07415 [Pseudomonadota bacterium]